MKKINDLYLIATPIGNLEEITFRALKYLEQIKIFFCEDTRNTKKLLQMLNISISDKKFYCYNLVNENKMLELVEQNLLLQDCALISDAGYPTISDPGYLLLNKLLNKYNLNPIVINGPCSLIHALVASNLPSNNFYFFGFLNSKENKKKQELLSLKSISTTIIVFESVHRLKVTLILMQEIYGDINIVVVKELTKLNETIYKGLISQLIDQIDYRGEFIIIFNNSSKNLSQIDNNKLLSEIDLVYNKEKSLNLACKIVAYKHGLKSNNLYQLYTKNKKNII